MESLQPLVRGVSVGELGSACLHGTFLGTDCGLEGAGMWHSLSGLMGDKDDCLDLARCFPLVRADYQPSCVGAVLRAKGSGAVRLVLKSADGRVLWWAAEELALTDEWQELHFSWDPSGLREVKSLHWSAEPGANVCLDSLSLRVLMPKLPFEEELFLLSFAKLARLYAPDQGTLRERAPQAPGERDSLAAAGLFTLATCVAAKTGMVKQAQAEQILRKVHATVADFPRAKGLLPASVRSKGGRTEVCEGALYSTLDTSIYYHSLLVAAQLLWDGKILAGLIKDLREIELERLRDSHGYLLRGVRDDARTPSEDSWSEWGGEAVLALLLEQMAGGAIRSPKLRGAGTVRGGVGLSAEITGLFYADFHTADVDSVTRTDWQAARRMLLEEQIGYFPRKRAKSSAARLGLYGLSVGEDPTSAGLRVSGTRTGDKEEVVRPYYTLMSGLVLSRPETAYDVLRTMKERGLIFPWGIVGGFDAELDHSPLVGSLSAALECIGAYHLWAEVSGQPDCIYAAVEDCGLLREAIRVFYPAIRAW